MLLAPYARDFTISFPLIKLDDTDFADVADYGFVAGDIQHSTDGGTAANVDNTPTEVDMAGLSRAFHTLVVSAAELTGKRCDIMVVDAAVEDQMITIYTYGHPDSAHPELGVWTHDFGTATAGAAGSITLATSASATADLYNGSFVHIVDGLGEEQTRLIVDYGVATRRADVEPNWTTNPDTTSKYYIIPAPPGPDTTLPAVNVTAWDGTAADVAKILSDTTATESELIVVHSDTSAIHSQTTVIESDSIIVESSIQVAESNTVVIESDTIVIEAAVSDVESSLVIVKSDLVIITSDTSAIHVDTANIYSDTTHIHSDTIIISSQTTVIESDSIANQAAVSDIESSLVIVKSDLVVIDNAVSDVESSLVIVKSDLVISNSQTTVIESDTTAIEAAGGSLTAAQDSKLTRIQSEVTVIQSDTLVIESDTTRLESGAAPTMSNLSSPPTATATMAQAMSWIFMMMRNKRDNDGSTEQIYRDDTTTVAGTSTVTSAGGTVTKGEFA